MEVENFAKQLEEFYRRTTILHESAANLTSPSKYLVEETLEELQVALEELRVAEEELRHQNQQLAEAYHTVEVERQRYQELFDFAPDGYLVTDSKGKILSANLNIAKLLQVLPDFIKGKILVNFIPKEERRAFRLQLLQLPNVKQLKDWQIHLVNREGKIFDILININSVETQGNSVGWRWLLRDITAHNQAQAQMQAIEKENLQLQEVARLKSQFLAMISHDLRTPMNTVLGYAQLLLRQNKEDPAKTKMMAQRIFDSGKHLLTLIEDMVDLSVLSAHKIKIVPEAFDLRELITETVEEQELLAQQKNLYLNVQLELENPIIINDRDRLRQVLVNLIANAIKFTETGGICIKVEEINQEQIAISVEDTGIGIAETDLKHIFEEFRQGDINTTHRRGGIGLGLAIVDKLLRLMKGAIVVSSKVGEGSIFRVELPRKF